MKLNSRRLLGVALLITALGRIAAPTLNAADKPAAPAVTLAPGMPAEQIVKLLGKPTEVSIIEHTGGKAENWIYRKPVAAKAGGPTTGYQVLTLLVIEGKLVIARQSTEELPAAGK